MRVIAPEAPSLDDMTPGEQRQRLHALPRYEVVDECCKALADAAMWRLRAERAYADAARWQYIRRRPLALNLRDEDADREIDRRIANLEPCA